MSSTQPLIREYAMTEKSLTAEIPYTRPRCTAGPTPDQCRWPGGLAPAVHRPCLGGSPRAARTWERTPLFSQESTEATERAPAPPTLLSLLTPVRKSPPGRFKANPASRLPSITDVQCPPGAGLDAGHVTPAAIVQVTRGVVTSFARAATLLREIGHCFAQGLPFSRRSASRLQSSPSCKRCR